MIRSLSNTFNNNKFLRSVVLIAGGSTAAQAITFLSAPIITRLYSPSDFGVLTIFTSIVGILGQLSTLRYAVAIPLADDGIKAYNIIRLCFIISFAYSLFVGLFLHFFHNVFYNLIPAENISSFFWLLSFCLLGIGFYETLSNWSLRQQHFKLLSKTKVVQGISSAIIKILLGIFGLKPIGLLVGFFASQVAGITSIFRRLKKDDFAFFKNFSLYEIWIVAKEFYKFPLFQTSSRMLLNLGVHLPAMFLAIYFDPKTAGLFGLAHSIVNLPMNVIGNSVSQVYYAEISKFGKHNIEQIRSLSISIIRKMFLVGLVPISLILITGPFLFSVVFGKEWYDSGVYARILSFIILSRFVASPISHCLDVLRLQGAQLLLNIIRVIIILILFPACNFFNASSFLTLAIYSCAMTSYYFIMVLYIFYSFSLEIN